MSLAFDIPTKGFSTLEVLGVGAAKKYKSNKIPVALDARTNTSSHNGKIKPELLVTSLTKRETVSPCV
jgi:tRNA A37 threonylcarbamoyladenosine modification protein TsaB